ncbi:MAG: PCMD domain-containing protein [Prevotella sp.]|nr:PCMD domain-containing protein [Prevotella sp.]MBR3514245.1 PCMD domain-containing protein [Bacteroidaceae bacterium]
MKKIFSIIAILAVTLVAASCSSENDELNAEVGYLKLGIETNGTLKTRASAPNGYDATQLYVEVKNAAGEVVYSTSNFDNDAQLQNGAYLTVTPGQYTVVAHSNNWDGNGSGFNTPYYYGETTATVKTKTVTTAKVTCTLANVKVTVNFSDEFKQSFARATATIESELEGVSAQAFTMGSDKGSAYFPVGNLTAYLSVFNKSGQGYSHMKEITGVQARDHYIINYTVAAHGYQGGVTVQVDPNTNTYTYTFEVPRKGGTSLAAYTANAWSTFAYLEGAVTAKKGDFDSSNIKLQWKAENANDWNEVENSALTINGDDISYKLTGLTANTKYTYRFAYLTADDEVFSAEQNFTTESQIALYNGGFENWYSEGRVDICGNQADGKYWNSSNAGAATYIGSVTTQDTEFKRSGNSSAKLATAWAVVKLAAASLFTGDFIGLIGTKGAKLDWGVPFAARPTSLKGYYSYVPGSLNRGTQPSVAPAKGQNDECQIFCALVTELFHVANAEASGYEMTTEIDWENDPRVVAYGQMTQNTSTNGQWQEFNIPLEYHSLTTKPTHLIIVCSASKYGDYFYGSDSSVLNLDDFELVYGDNPTVQ